MTEKTRLKLDIAGPLTRSQRRELEDHLAETAGARVRAAEDYGEPDIRVRIERSAEEWYPREPGDRGRARSKAYTATVTVAEDLAESDIDEVRQDLAEATQTWLAVNAPDSADAPAD